MAVSGPPNFVAVANTAARPPRFENQIRPPRFENQIKTKAPRPVAGSKHSATARSLGLETQLERPLRDVDRESRELCTIDYLHTSVPPGPKLVTRVHRDKKNHKKTNRRLLLCSFVLCWHHHTRLAGPSVLLKGGPHSRDCSTPAVGLISCLACVCRVHHSLCVAM